MLGTAKRVYLETRKKHDQLWNTFVMRPLASALVVAVAPSPVTPNQLTLMSLVIFATGAGLMIGLPDARGALIAIGVLELSYLFDCADGMLARWKKLASKQGHLFDFFTDEIKATLLVGSVSVRLFRTGGLGPEGSWPPGHPGFLLAGVAGVAIVASGISLTNFVRRPEISGQETPVAAHYEANQATAPTSLAGRVAGLVMTFLRFLNHYPSHIWIFGLAGRLDLFFWMYAGLNLLYLARGWLGLAIRFGKP